MEENSRIRELSFEMLCSERMCRTEFLFENVLQARELARVILPPDFTVMSAHERTTDGFEKVVIYWPVGDFDLNTLVRDFVRQEESSARE